MKTGIILAKIAMSLLLVLTLPAAASDYTLGVFGNANEDDTINMQDVTYTELIILEYRDKTELADGKYDGKINMQDVTQIELVILGKEKELTVIDPADRVVTIEMPVETIIPMMYRTTEAMLALGAKDMIVAVSHTFHDRLNGIDEAMGMTDLPVICYHGGGKETNYEYMLSLEPDLVIAEGRDVNAVAEKLPGIPVVNFRCGTRIDMTSQLRVMGFILGKDEEAAALADWIETYDGMIEERTKDMASEEMPTLYIEGWKRWTTDTPRGTVGYMAEGCGGRNIAADLPGSSVAVDPEWVLEQNPEVMIHGLMHGHESGPEKTEADLEAKLVEVLSDRPGFERVSAVENDRVYLLDWDLIYGPRYVIGRCYIAKWLHPELFGDIEVEELHDEYLSEFLGIELAGTWASPPLE